MYRRLRRAAYLIEDIGGTSGGSSAAFEPGSIVMIRAKHHKEKLLQEKKSVVTDMSEQSARTWRRKAYVYVQLFL